LSTAEQQEIGEVGGVWRRELREGQREEGGEQRRQAGGGRHAQMLGVPRRQDGAGEPEAAGVTPASPSSAAPDAIQLRSLTRSRSSTQPSSPAKNGAPACTNMMLATV